MKEQKRILRKIHSVYKKEIILSIISGILGTLSAQGVIVQLQIILDILIYNKPGQVLKHILISLGLIGLHILAMCVFQYYIRYLMLAGDFPLRKKMFQNSIRKEPSEITSTGDELNTITNDAEHISTAYTWSFILMITQSFQMILTLAIMFYYSVKITLIVVAAAILCYTATHIINKKIGTETVELQRVRGEENQLILQSIGSIKTIFQLGKTNYFSNRYLGFLKREKEPVTKKLSVLYSLYSDIFVFLFNLMPFLIVLLSVEGMVSGSLTVGSVLALHTISGALPQPIQQIAGFLNDRKIAENLAEKNKDLIKEEMKEETKELPLPEGAIEFKSKSFSFGEKQMLKDVTFNIPPGQIVTITGESGSGKSTLLNILSGFVKKQNGKMAIGGQSIEELGSSLYNILLQVEQSSILIEGSLLENLTLGDEYTEEEIQEVIETSQLSKLVDHVGLDYEITEGGKNLSGGERQRVGIARMLLRKPRILLLDEPTSALDEQTGEAMTKKLVDFGKKHKMTMIVVTHKEDFLKHADQKIHLKA
ncbi:MAG: ABC transporter ATP-binding protein [Tissierellia bacterium]|nr:ABC transporter ATP-binding protein [Tissierellia bacterium]